MELSQAPHNDRTQASILYHVTIQLDELSTHIPYAEPPSDEKGLSALPSRPKDVFFPGYYIDSRGDPCKTGRTNTEVVPDHWSNDPILLRSFEKRFNFQLGDDYGFDGPRYILARDDPDQPQALIAHDGCFFILTPNSFNDREKLMYITSSFNLLRIYQALDTGEPLSIMSIVPPKDQELQVGDIKRISDEETPKGWSNDIETILQHHNEFDPWAYGITSRQPMLTYEPLPELELFQASGKYLLQANGRRSHGA